MTYLFTDRVRGHADGELGRVFGVRPEEEMLEPVYSGMDEDDASFFQEVMLEAFSGITRSSLSGASRWTGQVRIWSRLERRGKGIFRRQRGNTLT